MSVMACAYCCTVMYVCSYTLYAVAFIVCLIYEGSWLSYKMFLSYIWLSLETFGLIRPDSMHRLVIALEVRYQSSGSQATPNLDDY